MAPGLGRTDGRPGARPSELWQEACLELRRCSGCTSVAALGATADVLPRAGMAPFQSASSLCLETHLLHSMVARTTRRSIKPLWLRPARCAFGVQRTSVCIHSVSASMHASYIPPQRAAAHRQRVRGRLETHLVLLPCRRTCASAAELVSVSSTFTAGGTRGWLATECGGRSSAESLGVMITDHLVKCTHPSVPSACPADALGHNHSGQIAILIAASTTS